MRRLNWLRQHMLNSRKRKGKEMTNEFTVGSQWITKGGWRAVVVDVVQGFPVIWHYNDYDTWTHNLDGTCDGGDDYTLDKPYTEPRKGTVWVNVYADKDDGGLFALAHIDKDEYEQDVSENSAHTLIASFKHDWTENEKL